MYHACACINQSFGSFRFLSWRERKLIQNSVVLFLVIESKPNNLIINSFLFVSLWNRRDEASIKKISFERNLLFLLCLVYEPVISTRETPFFSYSVPRNGDQSGSHVRSNIQVSLLRFKDSWMNRGQGSSFIGEHVSFFSFKSVFSFKRIILTTGEESVERFGGWKCY